MKKITIILILIIGSLVFAKQTNTMSKKTYDALIKAQKFIEINKFDEAKVLLNPLAKSVESKYEKSYILQSLANIAINDDDYKLVANYYEQIIKLNSFEKKDIEKIKFSLAKIYLSTQKYKKSISLLKELLSSETLDKNEIYETLSYSSYYDKQYKQTIKYLKIIINPEKKIKESWYQILYSSYIELKDYNNAIDTLELMVKKWHKNENYWLQLVALYQEKNKLKHALSTFELAYKKNGIKPEKNTLYFANILIQNGLYYKAALQIEQGIKKGYIENSAKNFELLISCYDYAKQKNKVKDLLENSPHAKTIKYQLLLANIFYNEEKYKQSIEVLKTIRIEKGTKIDGQRNTLLALCYYETNNQLQSKKYLSEAINNPFEKKRALSIKKSLKI